MAISPMMQQYMEIKEQYNDCILFFRLGDFYEMFFKDAEIASRELELVLTGKNCGEEERAPMCGVPFHAAENYIAKLVERGYKVAICEQMEDPALAKGIVKRDVIQIVTPGTVTSQSMLNEKENNYLASIFANEEKVALAYCDVSTGELCVTEFNIDNGEAMLTNELVKIKAKEVIISETSALYFNIDDIKFTTEAYFDILTDSYFAYDACEKAILRQFNIAALKGLGLDDKESSVLSLGALLLYISETQKRDFSHINRVNVYEIGKYMSLDKSTIRNLELTETLYDKKVQGSLLGVLDKTNTAMGSRRMKQWLREPLNNADLINERLDAVSWLYDEPLHRNELRESLRNVYDLERLAGRIASGNANGRDLVALKQSLSNLPEIKLVLSDSDSVLLNKLACDINTLEDISDLIEQAIIDDPPITIKEGGIIKAGYSKELDDLKFSIKDGQAWIAGLEASEREKTGIRTIKVGFNKVFGYYIEVSKSFVDQVPEHYIRKQTLVNGERYITPELKEMESLVLNAEAKINKLEYELFSELRLKINAYVKSLQDTAIAISVVDCLNSFAEVSERNDYIKPIVNDNDKIQIEKGRHPVIEQSIKDGLFVSNDTYMDCENSSLLLITGPNMSGKSTYMRQTALIVLMAQLGCFVPASKALIGCCDRIFTRIGASDNLAQGQSTFFVEMSELAYILNSATSKSLVILDEIGRGTSTYDGLSIAWALCEHLARAHSKVRTLFATHYHELTDLDLKGLKNLNVDVAEENGNVVFLHKIVEGSASKSYGIHVAKIAGVPKSLLDRANEKLSELENKPIIKEEQVSFLEILSNPIVDKIKALDLMELRPSEALEILEELQLEAKNND